MTSQEKIDKAIEVVNKCKPWVVSNKHSAKDMFGFQQALQTLIQIAEDLKAEDKALREEIEKVVKENEGLHTDLMIYQPFKKTAEDLEAENKKLLDEVLKRVDDPVKYPKDKTGGNYDTSRKD